MNGETEKRLERRSTAMIRVGGLALIGAFLAYSGDSAIWLLLALVGVALFVGGLMVKP